MIKKKTKWERETQDKKKNNKMRKRMTRWERKIQDEKKNNKMKRETQDDKENDK